MPESPWNAPTGPPGGTPARPNDIRHEIEGALEAAQRRDRELRAEILALTTSHVQASTRLSVATEESGEAAGLAKRALSRAESAARAGQRADAAKWQSAAEVFAMRVRDARRQMASLEQDLPALDEQRRRVEAARRENLAQLQALTDVRLPLLRGRKAGRVQQAVERVTNEISMPTDSLIAQASQAARAAEQSADEPAVVVTDDDLEREVDFEGTEAILDELRSELGLPGGGAAATAVAEAAAPASAPAGRAKGDGPQAKGNGPRAKGDGSRAKGNGPQAKAATGDAQGGPAKRSWPVPSTRR